MNPNLLKQLAIVVKQGSLSRACEQLFITQPTLTRSIQQIETKVGAPVLTRTRYGVVPTEIGARLAQIGERILAESEHGEEVIRQWHSGYQSEFTIGIDPLWEFATFREMTAHLLREKRHVFHLRTGSAALQIQLLQEGKLDFLLAPAHLSVSQSSLERELLFRDRSGVFVGKRSTLFGSKQPVSLDILAQQNWMIAGASAGFLDGQGELAGPQAARMAFTGSIRSVLHLLDTTDMLVRLPARLTLMTGELAREQLIDVEGKPGPRRDIALWSRSENGERPENFGVRELVREIVSRLDRESDTFGLDLSSSH
ncbi:LysR family transcriptional regulator [Marinobacterium sp. D7]|uniref:LysR family transcriptional regulator n=1 Tax=Marinobacterium ramblicola TaxID=2849041 RepID=UPI001C2D9EA6|nr:LysR family transcriptional regulator [Marinobacterium ramblicola]MBV1788064.1 LysR family transcriptional regulator [Marinobacterium ramblicola]